MPLSPSNITWYWSKKGDALWLGRWPQGWRKVMAAYRRGNDFKKSHVGWLPVHRDQLRSQRSATSMRELYLLPIPLWRRVVSKAYTCIVRVCTGATQLTTVAAVTAVTGCAGSIVILLCIISFVRKRRCIFFHVCCYDVARIGFFWERGINIWHGWYRYNKQRKSNWFAHLTCCCTTLEEINYYFSAYGRFLP